MFEMLHALVDMEVKTLIAVLFWGNVASVALILSYRLFIPDLRNRFLFSCSSIARLAQAAAYFCLFFRGSLPNIVSVNVGNSLLLTGFCLESLSLLIIIQAVERRLCLLLAGVLGVSLLLFNGIGFAYPDSSIRVVSASLGVFLIMAIPSVRLLTAKPASALKITVGTFYLLFTVLLIPHAFYALFHDITVVSNALVQSLTFISLILLLVFGLSAFLLLIKEKSDEITSALATTDYLTGLPNRRNFSKQATRMFEQSKQTHSALSILFLDIDYFKAINDRYGHAFGDAILLKVARFIRSRRSLGSSDFPCRYGGDEFVVLLHDVMPGETAQITTRIMDEVANTRFAEYPDFIFTVSIGVHEGHPDRGDMLEDYLEKADMALYAAKNGGRNRVVEYRGDMG
ncbi:MAG: GGDEF domain-containing protein [Zoogloeaceae bacterium]|jgi:diguanylate cyclase (GGDEF)-like protein|nr:GGDEF domain-containing protein [Zoogloeaceae bacterium]